MNAIKRIKDYLLDENTFVYLISFVLITLPLKHIINSISIILFSLIAIIYQLTNKNKNHLNRVNILFISIYILVIFSLFWTISFNDSLKGIRSMASYLFIPLGFYFMPDLDYKKVNSILKYFSFSMVFYAVYCLIIGVYTFIITKDASHLFYHELSSSLDQINAIYLSVYITFALFYFILRAKTKRGFYYFSISILSIFLFLLSSKLIIALSFIFSIIYLIKRKENRIVFTILIVISVFFIAPKSSSSVDQRFNDEINRTKINEILSKKDFGQNYYWTGFGLRLFLVRSYLEIANEDNVFLLGNGFNASQIKLIEKYKTYDLYPGYYQYNFHNQYIQFMVEIGLLSLIILVLIFYSGFKNSIRHKNLLFFGFNFLIMFLCITESYLIRQRGMVFFITIFLLLYKPPSNYKKLKEIKI